MYKIHYLPLALEDLKGIVKYIAYKKESPHAAKRFLLKLDREVLKIANNPFRCHLYASPEKLKYEYRVLPIDHYSLFYAVDNHKIEIRRVLYSRRDILRILTGDA